MFQHLLDSIAALVGAIEAESESLAVDGWGPAMAPLEHRKRTLTVRLGSELETLASRDPLWLDRMNETDRAAFDDLAHDFRDAATVNAAVIARYFDIDTAMTIRTGHR